jgi:hypothetical protein
VDRYDKRMTSVRTAGEHVKARPTNLSGSRRAIEALRLVRRGTECDEDETIIASSDVPGGLHCHCDELTGPDGHLLVVHDHPPRTAHEGIDVLDMIVEMVVAFGLRPGWQLDLVDLEGTNTELFADTLVEGARSRVRASTSGH